MWTRPAYDGPQPSPRECHSAVLDEVNDRIIFYGGSRLSSTGLKIDRFSEVITLDLVKKQWKYPVNSESAPQGRTAHSACIYGEKMYIYGGSVRYGPLSSDA
jgi:hypothetical protein